MEDKSIKQDGSWSEYQRLVLSTLVRLDESIAATSNKLNELTVQMALQREIAQKIVGIETIVADYGNRLQKLEQADTSSRAVSVDRRFIIGLLGALITAFVLPIAITYINIHWGS